jgi:hypothetical protein
MCAVVEQDGRLDFWRVNMRPETLWHLENSQVPFISLPGNPVSAYVGFEVFVRPALLKMLGWTDLERSASPALLLEAVESDGRESYLRAVVVRDNEKFVARLTGHQGSGNLRSLVQANALVRIPSGVRLLPAGSIVQYGCLMKSGRFNRSINSAVPGFGREHKVFRRKILCPGFVVITLTVCSWMMDIAVLQRSRSIPIWVMTYSRADDQEEVDDDWSDEEENWMNGMRRCRRGR